MSSAMSRSSSTMRMRLMPACRPRLGGSRVTTEVDRLSHPEDINSDIGTEPAQIRPENGDRGVALPLISPGHGGDHGFPEHASDGYDGGGDCGTGRAARGLRVAEFRVRPHRGHERFRGTGPADGGELRAHPAGGGTTSGGERRVPG